MFITLAARDTHFVPVYNGNPYQPMNIYVIEGSFSGENLVKGDEIAVFDSNKCVGVGIVGDSSLSFSNPLPIAASRDDGSNNGFTEGNEILYKIWLSEQNSEIRVLDREIQFYDNSGEKFEAPNFTSLGSARTGIRLINQAPEFTQYLPDTTINNDSTFNFTFLATDREGQNFVFGLIDPVEGLSIANDGELVWELPHQPEMQYEIQVFVTDSLDTTFTISTVQINDIVNIPPTSTNNEIIITEDSIYRFQETDFVYEDADGDKFGGIQIVSSVEAGVLSYQQSQVVENKDYQDVTALVFTPEPDESGSPYTSFDFIVMDSKGNYSDSSYRMTISVLELNDPPYFITNMPDTILSESDKFSWKYKAGDPDSDSLIYGIFSVEIFSDNENNWLDVEYDRVSIDSISGALNWEIDYEASGVYRIMVYVSDGRNKVIDTALVNIGKPNREPEFVNVFNDTTIAENEQIIFTYDAFDRDDDSLQYRIISVSIFNENQEWIKIDPAGMNLDSLTGVFSWSIDFDQAGRYRLVISVTDSFSIVKDTSLITVTNVNRPPEFIRSLPDTSINNDEEFNYTYIASDLDGDSLVFGLLVDYDGLTLSPEGYLNWQIAEQPADQYSIHIFVTDRIDTVVTLAKVTINDIVVVKDENIPDEYYLIQNYPNPFNPITTIKYGLPEDTNVKLLVYDINGKLIEIIVNGYRSRGDYKARWDAGNQSTGIYFYIIQTDKFSRVKKCILMK